MTTLFMNIEIVLLIDIKKLVIASLCYEKIRLLELLHSVYESLIGEDEKFYQAQTSKFHVFILKFILLVSHSDFMFLLFFDCRVSNFGHNMKLIILVKLFL